MASGAVNMRLAPALLPPLLDLDPDEAFFAGVADDTDQSSAARSLREVFRLVCLHDLTNVACLHF